MTIDVIYQIISFSISVCSDVLKMYRFKADEMINH